MKIDYFTADTKSYKQPIITFETESGGSITVTEEHFLVTGNGDVTKAKKIKSGMSLVSESGQLDKIVKVIPNKNFVGKAYNLAPVSYQNNDNIVVADGYLNGSVKYQEGLIRNVDRKIMRNLVPLDLLN